jgi:hypothetical protein
MHIKKNIIFSAKIEIAMPIEAILSVTTRFDSNSGGQNKARTASVRLWHVYVRVWMLQINPFTSV